MVVLPLVNIFFVDEVRPERQVNLEKNFPAFQTVDLDGQSATENIFHGKITALCIWSVKAEDSFVVLEKLDAEIKNLPENVQVIGLVGKVQADDEDLQPARIAAKKYSPSIRHLVVNDDFIPILQKIRTAPTTIFIDEQGNLIGQPAGGLNAEFIFRELNYILEKDSPRNQTLKKIQEIILHK